MVKAIFDLTIGLNNFCRIASELTFVLQIPRKLHVVFVLVMSKQNASHCYKNSSQIYFVDNRYKLHRDFLSSGLDKDNK